MDATSELSEHCARTILMHSNYVRMQIDLDSANDDMVDASDKNLEALEHAALSYLRTRLGDDAFSKSASLVALPSRRSGAKSKRQLETPRTATQGTRKRTKRAVKQPK
jgi:hypothetical protein